MRVAKTVGAATTDYLVDLAARLPVVISDTDAVYLYGLDIIAEQLAGADRYYYVHDGLGNVRQLLDGTGQIATRYAYDPFGVPLASNGVSNPWQFTGEAWDAEVELLYLRARYYQPETGRFVTKDPWAGDVWRPGTLHSHVYVMNNPANWVDPGGVRIDWQCGGLYCPELPGRRAPEPPPSPIPSRTPTPSGAPPPPVASPLPVSTPTVGPPPQEPWPVPVRLPGPTVTAAPCTTPKPPPAGSTWTPEATATLPDVWVYDPYSANGRAPGPSGPYCPEEAPRFSSTQLYRLADQIDAVSFALDESGFTETVTMALAAVGVPPPYGLAIGQSILLVPDAASALLRSYANAWKECGY